MTTVQINILGLNKQSLTIFSYYNIIPTPNCTKNRFTIHNFQCKMQNNHSYKNCENNIFVAQIMIIIFYCKEAFFKTFHHKKSLLMGRSKIFFRFFHARFDGRFSGTPAGRTNFPMFIGILKSLDQTQSFINVSAHW